MGKNVISWRLVLWTLSVSFTGLIACKLVDKCFFSGGDRFSHTRVGGALFFIFAVGWIVGLLLLLPLKLLDDQSEKREIEKQIREGQIKPAGMSPLRQAVFLAHYGHLPKWLYMPFLVIGLLLTAVVALIIVGLLVYLIVSW